MSHTPVGGSVHQEPGLQGHAIDGAAWKRSKPVADRRLRRRTGRVLRGRGAAERGRAAQSPWTCSTACRLPTASFAAAWRRTTRTRKRSSSSSRRPRRGPASASSATSRSGRTCRWRRCWRTTTRCCSPPAPRPTGTSAFPARICPAAIRPRRSSGGTTDIPTIATSDSTSTPSRPWSSATAMSRWTSPASWPARSTTWRGPTSPSTRSMRFATATSEKSTCWDGEALPRRRSRTRSSASSRRWAARISWSGQTISSWTRCNRTFLAGHPSRHPHRNLELLAAQSAKGEGAQRRKIRMRFFVSPVEILGSRPRGGACGSSATGWSRTARAASTRVGTGVFEEIRCGLVFRAVGYRGQPLPGLPFDDRNGIIPHRDGRVIDPHTGAPLPRVYVAGWIKRGPSGVIGTNRPDAVATVRAMLADAERDAGSAHCRSPGDGVAAAARAKTDPGGHVRGVDDGSTAGRSPADSSGASRGKSSRRAPSCWRPPDDERGRPAPRAGVPRRRCSRDRVTALPGAAPRCGTIVRWCPLFVSASLPA